ncbi:hypothetical protein HPB49_018964 [Dermacentor silvarum]|uniref:Uncharacterized protein n=1 Tax=Dermacentor silvarum TaxID=543639 RepID=A0ACB8C4Z0_DERSI|nr:hypothetical protein HPB49_018964 [Dermacentor silvarum]
MIGTLVIGQYLTGQVKAALLIRSPAPRIDTLEQMLERGPPIRPVTLTATPLMNMLKLSGLKSYRALHDRILRMRSEVPLTDIYSLRTLRQVVAGDAIIIMDATGNRVYVAPHCEALQPAYFHMSRQRLETADFRWYMNKRLDPRLVAAMDRRIRWLLEGAVPFMHHHEILRNPATCFLDQLAGSGSEAATGRYEVLHLEDANRQLTGQYNDDTKHQAIYNRKMALFLRLAFETKFTWPQFAENIHPDHHKGQRQAPSPP